MTPAVDLTAQAVAELFQRQPRTIRDWCERGLFPDAYKLLGREWRIPASGVVAFQESERERHQQALSVAPRPFRRGLQLSDWRGV